MKQSRHLLVEVIGKRTLETSDPEMLTNEVAAYLISEKRIDELDSIMRDVIEYRTNHGKIEASIISAHQLTNNVRDDIGQLLKQEYPSSKSITVNEKIDPNLVGGIRVVMPNEQLDLTLRSKLSDFKRLTTAGKA